MSHPPQHCVLLPASQRQRGMWGGALRPGLILGNTGAGEVSEGPGTGHGVGASEGATHT